MADMMEFTPDIYTLIDEEGNEQAFEIIDSLEIDDEQYFALVPFYDTPEENLESDGEFVILKSIIVDDEDMLATIDNDEEYEKIGNIFMERIEAALNEEDDEDSDEILQ